jgi:hypothetical protein
VTSHWAWVSPLNNEAKYRHLTLLLRQVGCCSRPATAFFTAFALATSALAQPADLVLRGGKVITVDK